MSLKVSEFISKLKVTLRDQIKRLKDEFDVKVSVHIFMGTYIVNINSYEVYKSRKYTTLLCGFFDEYYNKGIFEVCWGVDPEVKEDDLSLLTL